MNYLVDVVVIVSWRFLLTIFKMKTVKRTFVDWFVVANAIVFMISSVVGLYYTSSFLDYNGGGDVSPILCRFYILA